MSALLEKAFEEAKRLPENLQDELAAEWLQDIEDERRWAEQFANSQDKLAKLVEEAKAEILEGKRVEMGMDEL
jgi:hypothetical protein